MRSNILLDDWQQQVLDHEGSFVLCTGRQNGKTFIMSRKIGKFMRENPGCKIIVVSLTEDQAKLMIIMTLDYLESTGKDIARGKDKPTQNKIKLKNGSQVIARPVGNTGDAIRGFTGDVLVIDECSRMPELAIEAGRPTLFSTGGQIWMCSTPYGKRGYFYECFEAARTKTSNRFAYWHINSEHVAYNRQISESWTEKQRAAAIAHLEEEKKSKSKNYYGQEYLAMFLDDLRQFFDDQLIEQQMIHEKGNLMDGDYFLGVDIARFGEDQSSFEIICKTSNDRYYHVESIVTTKTFTTQTEDLICELDKRYNFRKIGIDAGSGSLGVGVYDHLRLREGMRYKLEAMNNRALALNRDGSKSMRMQKEDFYDNLKSMMEHKEIRLLKDEDVRLSLKSVQWEFTQNMPNSRDEEDTTSKVHIFGKYTHIAEGLVRAAWLAKQSKTLNIRIEYV